MARERGIKFICDLCGRLIEVGRPRFIFKGELYCAYDGAKFDESLDLPRGALHDEMKRLIELMEKKSEKELNDEVHYAFQLDLCAACRRQVYQMLEQSRTNHPGEPGE